MGRAKGIDATGQPAGRTLSLALLLSLALHGGVLAALAWWQAPRPAAPQRVIAVELVSGVAAAGSQSAAAAPSAGPKSSTLLASSKSPSLSQPRVKIPASFQIAALSSDPLPPPPESVRIPEAPRLMQPEAETPLAVLPPLPRRKPPVPKRQKETQPPELIAASKPLEQNNGRQQVAHVSGESSRSSTGTAGSGEATSASAAAGATDARFEGAGLANPAPRYPRAARRRGLEGRLVVRAKVSPQGLARAVWVEKSSGHPILDSAALDAVKTWQFIPATLAGLPVESLVDVPVSYRLQ